MMVCGILYIHGRKGKRTLKKFEIEGLMIYQSEWDFIDSNAYIITDKNSSVIIDPIDTKEFWQFLGRARIENVMVILTHEHFDHICGLNELREKLPCKVYAQKHCSKNIGITTRNLSSSAGAFAQLNEKVMHSGVSVKPFACEPADIVFDNRLDFLWAGHKISIIATPGHSKGSVCVVVDNKIAFTGDSLLEKPVITRLPGGNKKVYKETTRPQLLEISEKVEVIFPGHGIQGNIEKFQKYI